MKLFRIIVAAAIAAAATGCATMPPQGVAGTPGSAGTSAAPAPPAVGSAAPSAASIWPKIYEDESWLTSFESAWSEEQAVGTIRNLQNSMVEHKANAPIGDLNVDPFGMRARWTWVEGGYQKSSGFVVPFDQVSSMLLERYPGIDKEFKWGLLIYLEGNQPVSVRTPTRDAAERLGKAVYRLAKAREAKLGMPNQRVGASLGALSAEQAQAAGILKTDGIIVSWIFRDGPAERAGFSPQDIITGIGGTKVRKIEDFFQGVEGAAAAGASRIKVEGLRRSYRQDKTMLVEVFVPVTYDFPLAAGAPGETAPLQPTVKPAWQIEKQQASSQATAPETAEKEKAKNTFGAFFIGYDYPIMAGALEPHLSALNGPVNFSLGMETATGAGSSFLSGVEGEFMVTVNDRGMRLIFHDMAMIGYSIALAPLRLNLGLRLGLSMIDMTDDASAANTFTALGGIAGPEASLYLSLDPSSWIYVRGRYAWSAYMAVSGNAASPIATGDSSATWTSLQAGFAFKL